MDRELLREHEARNRDFWNGQSDEYQQEHGAQLAVRGAAWGRALLAARGGRGDRAPLDRLLRPPRGPDRRGRPRRVHPAVRRVDSALSIQRLRGRGSHRAETATGCREQLSDTGCTRLGAALANGAHLEGATPAQIRRLAFLALLGLGPALGGARLA